jgi:hypothetical protein
MVVVDVKAAAFGGRGGSTNDMPPCHFLVLQPPETPNGPGPTRLLFGGAVGENRT